MTYDVLANEFMSTMLKIHNEHQRSPVNNSLRGEKLILAFLANSDGKVIPRQLSDAMKISTARITTALTSLEKKGLIERKADENDRRKVVITLTEKGRTLEKENFNNFHNATSNMLEYLGENDSKELIRILKRIADMHCVCETSKNNQCRNGE